MQPRISIINDEISADIGRTISVLKANGVGYVEMRTLNGKNLVQNSDEELDGLADALGRSNIRISAIASPLFKWYPDGGNPSAKADSYFFDPSLSRKEKVACIERTVDIAARLNVGLVRIFSTLKPSGAVPYSLLDDDLFHLALESAKAAGIVLAVENEPPCYLNTMTQMKELFRQVRHPSLKLWFDVANFSMVGDTVTASDIRELSDCIAYFHLKDYGSGRTYVPLGSGVINYKRILSDVLATLDPANYFLSIETHVKSDPELSTVASLKSLRAMIGTRRARYGIIGCGGSFMKNGAAIAMNPESEVGAVYDVDQGRMEAASKAFDCEVRHDLGELLADSRIDVISIRTPHDTHAGLVRSVIAAGKWCLCEKPLCLTREEGVAITGSSDYRGNVFVNYQYRFSRGVGRLLSLVESGLLGRIVMCSASLHCRRDDDYFRGNWRGELKSSGGMLYNQGSHLLDVMRLVCGKPEKVLARARSVRSVSSVDDVYVAAVEFSGGVLGSVEMTTYSQLKDPQASLFVAGEKGTASLSGRALDKIEYVAAGGLPEIHWGDLEDEAAAAHLGLIEALNKRILHGIGNKCLCTAADAAETTEFILSLYENGARDGT